MKNQAGVKLENQNVIYWFRWDYWAAATFGPPTRTTRTATNIRVNLVDRNEILTMLGKSPDRHWKTTDYKMSGQLKKLESAQAELLKTSDRHLADVKGHCAQNKTMSAEKAYQCMIAKLDSTHAELIRILNSAIATDWLSSLSDLKDYHLGMLKQYQQTTENGNQTSLVSSTSAGDKDPSEIINDTGTGTIENA